MCVIERVVESSRSRTWARADHWGPGWRCAKAEKPGIAEIVRISEPAEQDDLIALRIEYQSVSKSRGGAWAGARELAPLRGAGQAQLPRIVTIRSVRSTEENHTVAELIVGCTGGPLRRRSSHNVELGPHWHSIEREGPDVIHVGRRRQTSSAKYDHSIADRV